MKTGLLYLRHLTVVIIIALAVAPVSAKDVTDVTAKVAAAVQDNKLSIRATNDVFGDTAPGIPKKLTIEYRVGQERLTREVGENGKIEIAAPADWNRST